jgi:uncharacterized protein (TIGR02145 family)
MSRGKSSFIARLASLATVVAVSVLVLAGCGGDEDNPGGPNGGGTFNYGTLTDSRDGKSYKTIKIGDQTWMAENLNYQTADNSWCYDNNTSNCAKYGRLYTWDAAMSTCPSDWHLPTRQEWGSLVTAVGEQAGRKLKVSDWGGKNEFGFSALPGGYRNTNGNFLALGSYGYWWTATERDASSAVCRDMYTGLVGVGGGSESGAVSKSLGYSVRCVQD